VLATYCPPLLAGSEHGITFVCYAEIDATPAPARLVPLDERFDLGSPLVRGHAPRLPSRCS
jgi:hypothetical protein